MLVTFDDEGAAEKVAKKMGGKLSKTRFGTFRIIKDEIEEGGSFDPDPNYLKDVLGYEPEDFEQEDPDQAAMDRMDAEEDDTVELANRDRPSAGPEDGLMGDVEALERLLDDETRAVMDDEGGTMSRREARETAKDILKQLIDRL
jgi:hypothetical protein